MMRKVMLGAVPALLMMGGAAEAAPTAWKVSEVSGPVTVLENGRSRAATKGTLLASGSVIATARGARAVIVRGGEFVVVSPGSRLRLPEEKSGNRIVQMIQELGSAVFKIEKKSTPHFGVQTPYLAAVVKGTTFTVTVGADSSKVEVSEGAVEVSTLDGGASDLVRPGMMAMVAKDDRFRLVVQGDETKVLRSPNAPTAGVSVPGPAAAAPVIRIAAVVIEDPVSLGDATDGLIDGSSAAEFAMAELQELARAADPTAPPVPDQSEPQPTPTPGDDDTAAPPPSGGDSAAPPASGGDTAAPPAQPAPPPPPPGNGGDKGNGGKDKDESDEDRDNGVGNDDKPGKGDGQPGKDAPGQDKEQPGKDDKPGKDDPGKDDKPGKDDPGKDDQPGKDDPGKDEAPGKDGKDDKPGKDNPGKDDAPGKGDQPGKDDLPDPPTSPPADDDEDRSGPGDGKGDDKEDGKGGGSGRDGGKDDDDGDDDDDDDAGDDDDDGDDD